MFNFPADLEVMSHRISSVRRELSDGSTTIFVHKAVSSLIASLKDRETPVMERSSKSEWRYGRTISKTS